MTGPAAAQRAKRVFRCVVRCGAAATGLLLLTVATIKTFELGCDRFAVEELDSPDRLCKAKYIQQQCAGAIGSLFDLVTVETSDNQFQFFNRRRVFDATMGPADQRVSIRWINNQELVVEHGGDVTIFTQEDEFHSVRIHYQVLPTKR